jgi:protein-tyrosine-phosphatase
LRNARITMPTLAVSSAGFVGPGRSSPAEAIAAAARVGLDLTASRSKLLTAESVQESSLIVVMAAEQSTRIRSSFAVDAAKLLVLGDLDPLPIGTRSIRDPWKGSDEVFDESYARIGRCIGVMIDCMPVPLDRADMVAGVRASSDPPRHKA